MLVMHLKKTIATVFVFSMVLLLVSPFLLSQYAAAQEEKRYFFRITLILDPGNIDAAEIMAKGWRAIGIDVNVVTMEFTTMMARYRFQGGALGSTYSDGGYDVALTGGTHGRDPDLTMRYHTDSQMGRKTANYNCALYSNGEVDRLLEEGLKYVDPAKRLPIYHRIQEILHDELPMIHTYRDLAPIGTTKGLDVGPVREGGGPVYDRAWEFKWEGKEGGSITFCGELNPPTMFGLYDVTTVQTNCLRLVYGRLYKDGPKFPTDIPELAESYDLSADLMTYTFHLRKGVTWHDGKPFTADDVIFTWGLYSNPDVAATGYGYWAKYVKSFKKIDDYTVQLDLASVFPDAIYRFANAPYMMPKHILGNVPASAAALKPLDFGKKPVGLGPYKVVEWKADEYMKFEAFKDYWRGKPPIDSIMFRPIPDKPTAIAALEKGEVNIVEQQIFWGALIQNYDRLKANPNVNISIRQGSGTNHIWVNLKHPVLSNIYVRRALAHAIDKDSIVKGPYKGFATACDQDYRKGINDPWYNTNLKDYEYSLAKAKALMEQAGYKYTYLEPPKTDPMVYMLPAIGGLVAGLIVGVGVDRVAKRKKT